MELQGWVLKYSPVLVALTEVLPKSGSDPGLTEILLDLPGYELVMGTSSQGHRGVALLVKKGTRYKINAFPNFSEFLSVSLFVEEMVDVGVLYRSPSVRNFSELAALIRVFFVGDGKKFLVGDFNMPGVSWEEMVGPGIYGDVLDVVNELGLEQLVGKFTRFGTTSSSILDLCFVKNFLPFRDIKYLSPLGKSDHSLLYLSFAWPHLAPERTAKLNWKGADFEGMLNFLSKVE